MRQAFAAALRDGSGAAPTVGTDLHWCMKVATLGNWAGLI
jgi:hypothetical protein